LWATRMSSSGLCLILVLLKTRDTLIQGPLVLCLFPSSSSFFPPKKKKIKGIKLHGGY
jgi:hypothetical protein